MTEPTEPVDLPEPVDVPGPTEPVDVDEPTEPDGARPRRRHRRVVRRGTETSTVAGTSADERPEGWSEPGATHHDAELLRDLPPHWGGAGYRD
ncbi:hypothetical protein [Flavimobilis rhizosphaerae]|uniref:hypothetical protein n=1 Tax=Flavimobilis rhizosphaerae TaxID=2775421 RepID=UPI001B3568E4|nr:hypothetical protein [Flavimobilis rhizosphaerae]